MCYFSVTGLTFTSNPDRFVIGDSGTLTMTCSVAGSNFLQVYNIKIKRAESPGSAQDQLLAHFLSGTAQLVDDVNDKDFTVSGDLDGELPKLELSVDISKLRCSDARMYKCEIGFESPVTGNIETLEHNITLQAFGELHTLSYT